MSPPIWGFPSVDFVRLLFFPFIKILRPNPAACCTHCPREQRRVRGVECPLPPENGSEKITSGKRTDPPKHRHWIRSRIVSPPWCPLQPARSTPAPGTGSRCLSAGAAVPPGQSPSLESHLLVSTAEEGARPGQSLLLRMERWKWDLWDVCGVFHFCPFKVTGLITWGKVCPLTRWLRGLMVWIETLETPSKDLLLLVWVSTLFLLSDNTFINLDSSDICYKEKRNKKNPYGSH